MTRPTTSHGTPLRITLRGPYLGIRRGGHTTDWTAPAVGNSFGDNGFPSGPHRPFGTAAFGDPPAAPRTCSAVLAGRGIHRRSRSRPPSRRLLDRMSRSGRLRGAAADHNHLGSTRRSGRSHRDHRETGPSRHTVWTRPSQSARRTGRRKPPNPALPGSSLIAAHQDVVLPTTPGDR